MELAALVCLTLVTAGLFWLARTKNRSFASFLERATQRDAAAGSMRVISRLHLSPQHSLHLVDTGESWLLVGCSPQGIAALREVAAPAAAIKRAAA